MMIICSGDMLLPASEQLADLGDKFRRIVDLDTRHKLGEGGEDL